MATDIAIGIRVSFRFWTSDPWRTGTLTAIYGGNARIKTDGLREVCVLPLANVTDPSLCYDLATVVEEVM
jgi:hypothetical protein